MADNQATSGTRPFRFGVVAPLRTALPEWRDQMRRIADGGLVTGGLVTAVRGTLAIAATAEALPTS